MKLVIDIPEEKYEWIKKNNPNVDINSIVGAIANGTPLVVPIQPWVYNHRTGTTGDYCQLCPTNPKNGGSGICNCILGTPKVTY